MAVTTNKTPAAKAPAAAKAATPVAAAVKTLLLELALYQRYATDGRIYEAGTVYEFTDSVALEKLQEVEESGRPLWKLHKTPKTGEGEAPAPKPRAVKVDLTPAPAADGTAAVVEDKASKRIEIGSEEELKELGLDTSGGAGTAADDAGGTGGGSDDETAVVV